MQVSVLCYIQKDLLVQLGDSAHALIISVEVAI